VSKKSYLSTIDLRISDVGYGGRGVGRFEGAVVFVPRTLTGELVRVGVTKKRKRYWEAEPVEVIEGSKLRIEPLCALFGICPGCSYQHADYREEVRIKERQLSTFFNRQLHVEPVAYLPSVAANNDMGYRNRLTFHASVGPEVLLGYVGEDNQRVLDVPCCPLGHGAINELIKKHRDNSAWMRSLSDGQEVLFRYTPQDGVQTVTKSQIVGPDEKQTRRPAWITEQTVLGAIRAPAASFFQVNIEIADALTDHVSQMIREIAPRTAADLYSGVGLFALAARKSGVEKVIGVDNDGEAIEAARRNTAALGLDPIDFFTSTADNFVRNRYNLDDSSSTLWIVDPPRRGLDSRVAALALERQPSHILYVSCAADTLTRDLAAFIRGGYLVQSVRLFDMFPRTPHFETVTHLYR
jgi:23S rRNA (uracil1939-C5)-methyltransferase